MPSIESVKKEYENILTQLSDPELISNPKKIEQLSKKKAVLEKIIEKNNELRELKNAIEENKEIINAQEDQELISLAEAEIVKFQTREKSLEKEIDDLLKGSPAESAVMVEIRAGAGGQEAALFVADLFKMYSGYSKTQNWREKVLNSRPSELGGFKEIIFEIEGSEARSKMQYEGGVHRVQRIPTTEKAGRVHTSTASVAVLPKPKKLEMKINPNDLRIEVAKSTGPGGQNVNKRMTAVRIVHLPSGLAVDSHTERNLQQNKENAMAILQARLLEKQKTQESKAISEKRRSQIKGAERADKIRTYNFPQDRVTDHRIGKSFHNIEAIMEGHLSPLINQLSESS